MIEFRIYPVVGCGRYIDVDQFVFNQPSSTGLDGGIAARGSSRDSVVINAFTTDLIVGFPGETEADFEDSLDVCRQIGFSKIHMFPFSARRETPAATMPDQIEKSVKAERGRIVRELEQQLMRQYFDSLVGQRLQLLVEGIDDDGIARGTSCRYATVQASGTGLIENELVDVNVTAATDDGVNAELLSLIHISEPTRPY